MKSLAKRVIVTFLLVTAVSAAALAKTNMATVSFSSDTRIGETLVKKGTYEVKFNEESGELSVVKTGKVIAKTTARLEKRDRKASGTQVLTILEGMDQRLVGIVFRGSDQNLVVNAATMQAGTR